MSTIGSSPGFDRVHLPVDLGSQIGLDSLRPQDQHGAQALADSDALVLAEQSEPAAVAIDEGELALNLPAWEGVAEGLRLFQGDAALAATLQQLDLASAADHASDSIRTTLSQAG